MRDDVQMKTSELIIDPEGNFNRYWREIWRYRELAYFLSWRDILVRYKQTAIGAAWAIFRPLVTTVVFTIIFGRLAKLPSEVPYPILVYVAMLPWQFFASALSGSSTSVVDSANLLTKVYFPRLIVPVSSSIVCFVDFLIEFGVMLALMVWYRFTPSWTMFWLPIFILLTFMAALGAGFWFAALNVKYRDFKYLVPFLLQFGLFISPVGFNSSVVPESWRLWYSLNPMVGIIDGFRWAILGIQTPFYVPSLVLSVFGTFVIFLTGLHYFRRTERGFADVI